MTQATETATLSPPLPYACTFENCDRTFENERGRIIHEARMHNPAAMTKRPKNRKASAEERTCTLCPEPRTFDTYRGLRLHLRFTHNVEGGAASPVALTKPEESTDHATNGANTTDAANSRAKAAPTIDPLIHAVCLGHVEEVCRRVAEKYCVATPIFIREFAEFFYRDSRR